MPASDKPIPALFPDSLLEICLGKILDHLILCGQAIEERAKREHVETGSDSATQSSNSGGPLSPRHELPRRRRTSSLMYDFTEYFDPSMPVCWTKEDRERTFFTRTEEFERSVSTCRDYLVNFLASHLLDSLTDSARRQGNIAQAGHLFCFSVLCNERLAKLVACHHGEEESTNPNHEDIEEEEDVEVLSEEGTPDIPPDWTNFLESAIGSDLFLVCLEQMSGLTSLTIHHVCSNDMIYIIADTCTRLQVLDVSFSSSVSDLGLLYLCGTTIRSPDPGSSADKRLIEAPRGCKYLRELVFNPHSKTPTDLGFSPITPKVIACLLKHLQYLEVLDLEQLHAGIEYYCKGPADGSCILGPAHHSQPLKLVHYTGSDRLAEVMQVCPKLRTFKLFVTDALPRLGTTLQNLHNSLDHVTLVYNQDHLRLDGLQQFLKGCGSRIRSLEIECTKTSLIWLEDLEAIAEHCTFLEILCFTSFYLSPNASDFVARSPLPLPFLTELRVSNIEIDSFGKEVFKYLLGDCLDLEVLYLSFADTAYYFSDFLLDDILNLNPLGRVEQFILKDVSLTLISALRLISSRPKLRNLGRLLKWDVEPSELKTFAQILRKANSLKLLQNISIV